MQFLQNNWSDRQKFFKIRVLKNFAIFTAWKSATLLQRLQQRCFPVNIEKRFRTAFFIKHLCGYFWIGTVKWIFTFTRICILIIYKSIISNREVLSIEDFHESMPPMTFTSQILFYSIYSSLWIPLDISFKRDELTSHKLWNYWFKVHKYQGQGA